MPQPENGQPTPSQPEASRGEIGSAFPEFKFDPNGVGLMAEAAIHKLVEVAQAGGRSPMKADGITLDPNQFTKNMRQEAEARTIGSTLELIVPRTDGEADGSKQQLWIDFFEAEAAERVAQAAEAAADPEAE